MNLRNFIGTMLSATAGFAILPGATLYTRQWKPTQRVMRADVFLSVGTVHMWAGASLPEGFILCNGQSLARVGTYANLYAVIGTTYGAADANSFSVPLMEGIVIET